MSSVSLFFHLFLMDSKKSIMKLIVKFAILGGWDDGSHNTCSLLGGHLKSDQ